MTCDEVRALLSDALDGAEVDGGLEAAAAAHLETCVSCARSARELSSIHRLILEDRAAGIAKPVKRPARRPLWIAAASLAACLVLGLAAYFLLTPGAVLEQASGRVLLGETPARSGDAVRPGVSLRTDGATSRVTVSWPDGTRLEVDADTALDRIEAGRVSLRKGSLSARVSPRKHPLVFATPDGEARVLGTTLRIAADPKEGTRLEVREGTVELKNAAGKSVAVETGHFAVAAAGVDLVARKLESGWTNVTGALGGNVWGFGGIHALAAVPGRDEVIAGVSNSWLWSTKDGGATWSRLGNGDLKNRPYQFIFDPTDSRIFWISGTYGPGVFKTTDGGVSFRRLGTIDHVDGLAVDFSDPARRTILATRHLNEKSLHRSSDGGETWEKIGDRIQADSCFPSDILLLDSNTYVINSVAAGRGAGIYRTADAGRTWTRVSDLDPRGPALAASNGSLYWQQVNAGGLFRSLDRGLTWSRLPGPVRTNLIEIPDGRLVGAGDRQLFASANGGVVWSKLGPSVPIRPLSVVYDARRRSLFCRQLTDQRSPDAIFRWDMTE